MILNNACRTGKRSYTSKFEADQAAVRTVTGARRRRGMRRGRLHTYRCPFCPHFHIGNDQHEREAA